jgi:hypothetical protein
MLTFNCAPSSRRAIRLRRLTRLIRRRRLEAARGRVQRHLVMVHQVDRLNDVDLAVIRPGGAHSPERGPHGAPEREMHDVNDKERANTIRILRGDTDLWRVWRVSVRLEGSEGERWRGTYRVAFIARCDVARVVYLEDCVAVGIDVRKVLRISVITVQPPNIT